MKTDYDALKWHKAAEQRYEMFSTKRDKELGWSPILRSSSLPTNPEWMSEPVRIRRVGRGFMVKGHAVEMDEVVWCDRYTAQGLVQMGKAAWVDARDATR